MIENIDFDGSALQQVRLFLCHPSNRQTIAELVNIKDKKLVENYGGINELTFSVLYNISNENGEHIRNPLVDLIRGNYLIRYEKGIFQDYYMITNPTNEATDDGKKVLRVQCYQMHYEWKDKLVREFKGTKMLYDPVGNNGVLNETLLKKTDWSMGYVDGSLFSKYRTFDESERNLLEFVFEAIDTYGSYIPVVDTVNKKLSIYLDENYGKDEGLSIEYGKYLKSINEEENFDDVTTRLYIYGKDNMSINRLNPTGTDYLESFDYYMYPFEADANGNVIKKSRYMSDGLCIAILNYNKLVKQKSERFKSLLLRKEELQEQLIVKENELTNLEDEKKILLDEKDVLISTGNDLSLLNQKIVAKDGEINRKLAEITSIKTEITIIDNEINLLKNDLAIERNFTPDQIKERNFFIKEKTWQDNNYTKTEDLLEQGTKYLLQWSQPQVVYSVNAVDFLNALNTKYDWNRLKLGTIVTIKYPDFGINIKAKVITIDHDIDNNALQLTIANTKDIKSGFTKITDLLNRSVNTSTQVDMSKYKWDLSEENNTEINKIINNVWDANKNAIEGGDNLQYRLDTRGLTIKSPTDPLKYLRAVNSVIAITNDGGNTWKNALTWQGLIAERLYGMIIAGANLTIENTSGTFRVDGEGVTVTGMNMSLITTNVKNKININPTDGIRVQKNIGTTSSPIWQDQISLDAAGDASFSGNVTIGTGNDVFKATGQGIQLGHASFGTAPFRVDMRGNLTANSAVIRDSQFNGGVITGSSINVNGRFLVDSSGNMSATNARFSGDITGSTITGSLFKTATSGRRIELDQRGFRAIDSSGATRISIQTDSDQGISGIGFNDSYGSWQGQIIATSSDLSITAKNGLVFSGGIGGINHDSRVYFTYSATFNSPVTFNNGVYGITMSDINGLQSELTSLKNRIAYLESSKANKGSYTSSSPSFNGGIAPGTVLVTASGGRVTWQGIPGHDHRQN